MTSFSLTVARVGEELFSGEARALTVPSTEGELTILSLHEPLITRLNPGTLTVVAESGEAHTIPVSGGVLEVSSNQATVLL